MRMNKRNEDTVNLKKVALVALAVYLALAVGFAFLAGDQLLYRDSRGDVAQLPAESGTVELCRGAVVEQTFVAEIQRLETVSVQWGTYYRPNAGTVTMELWNVQSNQCLLRQEFDAGEIQEGGVTALVAETPMEGVYGTPLLLRLYADSQPGSAASPMMNQTAPAEEGFALTLNGAETQGVLCFSATGTDYIWTGIHYWLFVAIGLAIVLCFFALVRWRYQKGHSYVVNALVAMKKYRFLIRQLVGRDFKTKYKRSVLGVFWSFLNPLLTMLVQYMVFSTLFKSDIPNFPAYLIVGTVLFNFFNEACGMSLTSILNNSGLITKVYMPKYIYPLTRVMSSGVNLLISLIPMLLVCLVTGVTFQKSTVLALFFLLCTAVFSLGLGLLLSTAMVFFRDTQFLWGVISMIWMYATPIFYPESILPEELRFLHTCNPLYHFLKNTRLCILDGISPEPAVYARCFLMALGALLVGALVFHKNQDKFVLYL